MKKETQRWRKSRLFAWLLGFVLIAAVTLIISIFNKPPVVGFTWQQPVIDVLAWSQANGQTRLVTSEDGIGLCFRNEAGELIANVLPPTGFGFTNVCASKTGMFYAGTNEPSVCAFTSDGVERWVSAAHLSSQIRPGTKNSTTQVTTDANGQVYAVTSWGDVTAFDEDGEQVFSYSLNEKLFKTTPPLAHTDGTLYVENNNGETLCINSQGEENWRFPQG